MVIQLILGLSHHLPVTSNQPMVLAVHSYRRVCIGMSACGVAELERPRLVLHLI